MVAPMTVATVLAMANADLRDRNKRTAMGEVQRVAVRLMRSNGFGNVTVEEISTAAGVSASTIYRYFGTKEALVLWGDRPTRLVTAFAAAKVGKRRSAHEAFMEAAVDIYSENETDLLAQLVLVFASGDLTVAFEHDLVGRRHDVAAEFAKHAHRKHSKGQPGTAGLQDLATAGAHLGLLVAVLDRWQATGGKKSVAKMLSKASRATQAV
jgi:AcrR family transcriptional regulator